MYDNHINLSFLSKIRVLLVSLHDTASANQVRKIPRSGTVRGVLRTTLIASARAMPGSYPGELVSVSIPRNLTKSPNICSKPQATWEGYSTNICIKTQQRGYELYHLFRYCFMYFIIIYLKILVNLHESDMLYKA